MAQARIYYDAEFEFELSAPKRPRLDFEHRSYTAEQSFVDSEFPHTNQIFDPLHDFSQADLVHGSENLVPYSQNTTVSRSGATSTGFDPALSLERGLEQLGEGNFEDHNLDIDLSGQFHNLTYYFSPVVDDPSSELRLPDVSAGPDLLCFGMVCEEQLSVRALNNQILQVSDVPITSYHSSLMDFGQPKISLSFQKPNHLYQIDHGRLFGELDNRTAEILTKIDSEGGIELQIYCRTINRRAAPGKKGSRKPGGNELQYVMNVIIYGSEDVRDGVGEYLVKCGMYLQDPIDCDRNVVYSNPQFLCRTEEHIMTYELASLNAEPEVQKAISKDDIFSERSCDDHLSLTEAPDAINKALYK
jgi:hypothetical protein